MNITRLVLSFSYPINHIIDDISYNIINSTKISDIDKSIIFINISKCDKRLNDGANEYIQLLNIFTTINSFLSSTPFS